MLKVLDIGENSIQGKCSNGYENMKVLRLSSNKFYGTISSQLCQLSELQMLDLVNTKLTGNIPH